MLSLGGIDPISPKEEASNPFFSRGSSILNERLDKAEENKVMNPTLSLKHLISEERAMAKGEVLRQTRDDYSSVNIRKYESAT